MAAPVLSAQTPSTGYISWTAFGIQFNGVSYSIAAGNTAEPFVWWRYNGGSPLLQAGPLPSDTGSDKLLPEDLVLFGNKLGTPLDIQRTSYLPGDLLVDGSVIGEALAAETVTGAKMVAGTVSAREVSSDIITVGKAFVQDGIAIGDPTVNQASIRLTRTDGYRQTDAQGVERLLFPINPSADAPFVFDGDVTARSLTVKSNMNVQGANNVISGQVALSNGVTRPLAPPSLSAYYPSVQTFDPAFLGVTWYGAVPSVSDNLRIIVANAFFGGGIGVFFKDTGQVDYSPAQPEWGKNNFNPTGGITAIGSSYYVLGQDGARNGFWYIYRLNSAFEKIGERGVAPASAIGGRPTIGNDGTNILVAMPRQDQVDVYGVTADLTGALNSGNGIYTLSLPGLNYSPLSFIGRGAFDFGATRILCAVEGNFVFHFAADGTRDDTQMFYGADGGSLRGLVYMDGTLRSLDTQGHWATYSSFKSTTTITGSYTWYDGVGTVRETQASPGSTYSLPARSWPRIQTAQPPDNGVATSNPDKANRVGIYMATGAAARRLQTYLPVDGTTFIATREYRPATISTSGQVEPTVNGFIGSTAGSPGVLVDAFGNSWTGAGMSWCPPGTVIDGFWTAAPTGFALLTGGANGTLLDRMANPILFAMFGTTYNTGGETATQFRLPKLSGKGKMGLDTSQTEFDVIGESGGAKTHTLTINEMPSHQHTQALGGSITNTNAVAGAPVVGTANTSLTNATGGGAAHNNLGPYIVMNMAIKLG